MSEDQTKNEGQGYYRIVVSGKGDSFVEATFCEVDSKKQEKETLSGRKVRDQQSVIVRDYRVDQQDQNHIIIFASEVIDANDYSHLGNYVEFNGTDINIASSKKIDPPNFLPLPNKTVLRIRGRGSRKINVYVHDLRVGEISYKTQSLVLHGVDLLVQGHGIEYGKSEILVDPLEDASRKADKHLEDASRKDDKHLLIVKGGSLSIDGVRAADIDEVRIQASERFRTIATTKPRRSVWEWIKDPFWRWIRGGGPRLKSVGLSVSFVALLAVLGCLTALPFVGTEQAIQQYEKLWQATVVSSINASGEPSDAAKADVNSQKSEQATGETTGAQKKSSPTDDGTQSAKNDATAANSKMKFGTGGIAGLISERPACSTCCSICLSPFQRWPFSKECGGTTK